MISSTVERWDTDETRRRLELQVGRDLQFIRINGTVVGALAGLAIYTRHAGCSDALLCSGCCRAQVCYLLGSGHLVFGLAPM